MDRGWSQQAEGYWGGSGGTCESAVRPSLGSLKHFTEVYFACKQTRRRG